MGTRGAVLMSGIGIPPGYSHYPVVPAKFVLAGGLTGKLLQQCPAAKDCILGVRVGIHAPGLGVMLLSMMNDEGSYHRPVAASASSCGTRGQRIPCWLGFHQCGPPRGGTLFGPGVHALSARGFDPGLAGSAENQDDQQNLGHQNAHQGHEVIHAFGAEHEAAGHAVGDDHQCVDGHVDGGEGGDAGQSFAPGLAFPLTPDSDIRFMPGIVAPRGGITARVGVPGFACGRSVRVVDRAPGGNIPDIRRRLAFTLLIPDP